MTKCAARMFKGADRPSPGRSWRRAAAGRSCGTIRRTSMGRLSPRSVRRVVCAALLIVAATISAAAQIRLPPPQLLPNRERVTPYLSAVRAYRAGHVGAALETAIGWEDLPETLAALRGFEPYVVDRGTAPEDVEWLDLEAAVLMHTDAALVAARSLMPAAMERNLHAALALIEWLDQSGVVRAKRGQAALPRAVPTREWFVFALVGFSRLGEGEAVANLADRAVRRFPKDAAIQLAAGTIDELRANALLERYQRAAREQAVERFRAAFELDPALSEAVLRQGRVLWMLGRHADAVDRFERVLRDCREDRVRYLAYLFLGAEFERRNRSADAMAQYQSALTAQPGAQAARTALAFALQQAGRTDEARQILDAGLRPDAPSDMRADPYWTYGFGPAFDVEALFAKLYNGVRR